MILNFYFENEEIKILYFHEKNVFEKNEKFNLLANFCKRKSLIN